MFIPKGWWNEKTTLAFFAGAAEADVSFSVTNMFQSSDSLSLPVDTVSNYARELGDDYVDILKIDIVGAEKVVLHSMLADGLHPSVLCVEFDMPLRGVLTSLRELKSAGYRLLSIDGWNYTLSNSRS